MRRNRSETMISYASSSSASSATSDAPITTTSTTMVAQQDKNNDETPFAVEGCEGPYIDYLTTPIKVIKNQMQAPKSKRKGPRGGVSEPFPVKLYEMLIGVQQEGLENIVSWQTHGRCFVIHVPKAFVEEIMPRYFKQSKLTSFQRQLNLYGFQRVTSGRDRGGYYHPLFLRGRPDICKVMLRTRVKGGAASILPGDIPTNALMTSFYALPACPPASQADSAVMVSSDEEDSSSSASSATGEQQQLLSPSDYLESALEPTPILEPTIGGMQIVSPPPQQQEESNVRDYQQQFFPNMMEPTSSGGYIGSVPMEAPSTITNPTYGVSTSLPTQFVEFPSVVTSTQTSIAAPLMVPNPLFNSNEVPPPSDSTEQQQQPDLGFFEGRKFQFMDPDRLMAYEHALIGKI